jgi:hypothetical protein
MVRVELSHRSLSSIGHSGGRGFRGPGAEMSNDLETDRAIALIRVELWRPFRVIGADGVQVQVGCYCETETESPSSTNPQ